MKKKIYLALIALLLTACTEEPDTPMVKTDESGQVITVARDALPEFSPPIADDSPAQWPESEYRPLTKAGFSAYCGGRLYYIDESGYYINFVNFETGAENIACFDPLCDHGKIPSGGTDISSDCTALMSGRHLLARQEENGIVLYYDAQGFSGPHYDRTTEIRRFDIANNKVSVIASFSEYMLNDFWFYGDDLLLSLSGFSTNETDVPSGLFRLENKKPQLLIEANQNLPALIGSDDRGLLWRMGTTIYLTASDFSATAALMENANGQYPFYHDGYLYYYQAGEQKSCTYEIYNGEYDEAWSSANSGTYTTSAMDWYRIRTGQDAQPELVCSGTALTGQEAFFLDEEKGILYLQLLNPQDMGYIVWEDNSWTPAAAEQMGFSGKPLLTRKILVSGGGVVAVDLTTLEQTEVYRGLDGDIWGMYGLHNGQLAVKYLIKDTEKIRTLMEHDPPNGSSLDYPVYTCLDLEN